MTTLEEYLKFLVKCELPLSLKVELKVTLQEHFEEESGQWVRRQLDRINKYHSHKVLFPMLRRTLREEWRRKKFQ